MSISGCILAKNEQKLLPGCINSIKNFVDEIIVIDNNSTDETKSIAKNLGCTVISVPKGDECYLRNKYIELSKSSWILAIDADERITPDFSTKIKEEISNASENIYGFRLPWYNYIGDGKWSSAITCKFFRNNLKIRYEGGNIHPTIASSIFSLGGNLGFAFAPLHHLDILVKNRTSNKRYEYIKRIHETIKNSQSKIDLHRLYNYLGVEYTAMGEYDKAEEQYKLAINNNIQGAPLAYLYLTQNYLLKGDIVNAEAKINQILNFDQEDILNTIKFNFNKEILKDIKIISDDLIQRALTIKAEIEIRKNNFSKALNLCEKALELWPLAAQHYINIASLIKDINPEKYKNYINNAIKLNPYIKEKIIYGKGELPNIFCHQTSFLSCTNTIFNDFKEQFGTI